MAPSTTASIAIQNGPVTINISSWSGSENFSPVPAGDTGSGPVLSGSDGGGSLSPDQLTELGARWQKVMSPDSATTQNDIADFLKWVAELLGGGSAAEFLLKIADWFEELTSDKLTEITYKARNQVPPATQAQFVDAACVQAFVNDIKIFALNSGKSFAEGLPVAFSGFIGCAFGNSGEAQAQFIGDLKPTCILSAIWTYMQTRDITATLTSFLACQFGTGGGIGGGGGSSFQFPPVARC